MTGEQKNSSRFVSRVLAAHSVLGLFIGGLMYVICLSGTIAVLYPELERWERPNAPEFLDYAPAAANQAAERALAAAGSENPDHLFLTLPTRDMPRLVATVDEEAWVADRKGRLVGPADHDWVHFLEELHIYLSMPGTFGLTLVGVIGVLLVALIISGFLAHPRIVKDAFALRKNRSPRLGMADLHNRLSVWGAPFHLAIAATGAFIGLSTVILFLVANVFYDGDTTAASAPLFAPEPPRDSAPAPLPDLAAALSHLEREAPDMTPFSMTVHEPGTAGQHVEVVARVPDRLVWGERFYFDAAGNLTGTENWADGTVGKQIYISTFRLHFGHFGGLPVKLAYVVLGLGLCAVTASGVNIWLLRRRRRGQPAIRAESLWAGVVWGTPFALALSALLYLAIGLPPTPVFWGTGLLVLAAPWLAPEARPWARDFRLATGMVIIAMLAVHTGLFGLSSWIGLGINTLWLAAALAMIASAVSRQPAPSEKPAV